MEAVSDGHSLALSTQWKERRSRSSGPRAAGGGARLQGKRPVGRAGLETVSCTRDVVMAAEEAESKPPGNLASSLSPTM